MMRLCYSSCLLCLLIFIVFGCNKVSEIEDTVDTVDTIVNPPNRKPIDTARLGTNAFFNQQGFGTISEQAYEVRDVLRLKFVRVLISWLDETQSCETCPIKFGFSDDILNSLPLDVDALIVITNMPSWAPGGEAGREVFANNFVRKVVTRYANHPRVVGWQIWNEPDNPSFKENDKMEVRESVTNYVELIALTSSVIRDAAPNHLIVNGATRAIAQNFPDTLRYNRRMVAQGIEEFIDIYAIHYYGTNYENVVRPYENVRDFTNDLNRPIWITETGRGGINNQLSYAEKTWPFLRKELGNIDRIYQYRFTSTDPADKTEGLRNLTSGKEFSDLYIYLRDRL